MTGTGAAILGGSALLSGTAVGVAVIARKAVSEAASAIRDGQWRGYSVSLSFAVRPPAAKAQRAAEALPAPVPAGAEPAAAAPPRGYLTRSQAAQRLGVDDMEVRRLTARGVLDPQPRRATLVTAESVQRYEASQNVTAKETS